MYNLKYDFKQYNNAISTYFNVLIEKSSANFRQQVRNGIIENNANNAEGLSRGIEYFEDYLFYNLNKYPQNFNSVLNSMMSRVTTIAVLPQNERGIYGKTETQNKTVYINPELPDSNTLTGEERTRLYMGHELGHVINDSWMSRAQGYFTQQIGIGRLSANHAQLLYEGFSMLDEAIAQNRAENFAYEFSGKKRPRLAGYRNGRLFNGEMYHSNFDFYGELQEPATMFARTLRGIGKENDDLRALDMLSERAFSSNFFDRILNEYSRDGQMATFVQQFQYMGLLRRAAYANFGYEDAFYLENSSNYLANFRSISSSMRDFREPFEDSGR